MAIVTWRASYGLDLRDLNFSSLYYGTKYVSGGSSFVVHYDLGSSGYFRDEFRGSQLTYDSRGVPVGGEVNSYKFILDGKTLGSVSGFQVPVAEIAKAAATRSKSDDMAVYKLALSGNDRILGGRADDLLEGFGGSDKIQGGLGADKLLGGSGADAFLFKSVRDSTFDIAGRDRIMDFSRSQADKIDLMSIDANATRGGNQAFAFIGKAQFHNKAGELRYEKSGGQTHVYGDIDGDGQADVAISLKGYVTLSKGDFYL